jgi:hypothetical protein
MIRLCGRAAHFLVPCALALSSVTLAQVPDSGEAQAPVDRGDAREARDPALAMWVGHVESDNIARASTSESGSYENIGLFVDLAHTSSRVETSINTDLEFRTYSEDTIEDETVGALAAMADFDLVGDVFGWDFREDYNQGRKDPFAPIGPANREEINVFSSGPQFDVPLGGRTILSIGGDYSARRYGESTSVDSDSVLYQFSVFRQTGPTARVGIVASSDEVDYTDLDAPPYDIDRLSLRYEKTLATGRVLADIGTNEISSGNTKADEPMFNFEWSRSLTARSYLAVTAARQVTDSGGLLSSSIIDAPIAVGEILVSASPLESKRLGTSYVLTLARTDVTFAVAASNESYIGSTTLDNDSTTTRIAFNRTISPRSSLGVAFDEIQREYKDSGVPRADDKDTTITAWFNRSLGRRFSVALAWSRYERSGTQAFDEQRYEVRFGYSPTESSAAAMRSIGR